MAIGARDAQVVRMVFRDGMFPAFAGIALGLAGASALSRFMESLLFGITRADPAAYLFAATVLMLACATALLAPARRAAAIDPASTLRAD
jgi:ABC-type antimicrobial peptide transport system permease subunit